jgi:hypothetical protein
MNFYTLLSRLRKIIQQIFEATARRRHIYYIYALAALPIRRALTFKT